MLTILILLLVLAVAGGGWGHTRGWGAYGWSPLGVLLVIFLVLALSGHLGSGSLRLR